MVTPNPVFMRSEIYSESLGMQTSISVIIPGGIKAYNRGEKKYKTVFVLPGGTGIDLDVFFQINFIECTEAKRLLNERYADMVFIIPSGYLSYWMDHKIEYKYAHNYYTYLTKELPSIVRNLFPLSSDADDTAIYGMSMGGWGSFSCGLNNPHVFGHVGSQSGMVDMQWSIDTRPHWKTKHERMMGTPLDIEGTRNDIYAVAAELNRKKARGERVPRIYQSWGEKDYLIEPNTLMSNYLKTLTHLDYTAAIIPGVHGWGPHAEGFWNFVEWLADYWNKEG